MVEVYIHGKMAENMMVNINMIKNMDLVYIHGLIVDVTKDNGLLVNNMVKVNIYCQMVALNMVYGKMVKE